MISVLHTPAGSIRRALVRRKTAQSMSRSRSLARAVPRAHPALKCLIHQWQSSPPPASSNGGSFLQYGVTTTCTEPPRRTDSLGHPPHCRGLSLKMQAMITSDSVKEAIQAYMHSQYPLVCLCSAFERISLHQLCVRCASLYTANSAQHGRSYRAD